MFEGVAVALVVCRLQGTLCAWEVVVCEVISTKVVEVCDALSCWVEGQWR